MNEKLIKEEINQLLQDENETSYQRIIDLVNQSTEQDKYKKIKNQAEIKLLEIEISKLDETDKKNIIHLTGKLIKLYKKQMSLEATEQAKLAARYKVLELQKRQKELTKDYKNSNKELPISEKVALTVQDIANTIKVFVNEKDLLTKVKNIGIETLRGTIETTAFMAIISLISPLFGGVGFSMSMLAKALPVASYVGLTSVIRNTLSKTQFQQFQYYQSDEYKEYMKQFKEENKTVLAEFNSLLKEKSSCETTDEKITINESLISKLDEIASKVKDDGLRRTYKLQAYGFLRENKELCQTEIDKYLDELSNDKEKYKKYQAKMAKINIESFKRGNSLGEAIKQAGKEAGLSLSVTIIAKAIMTLIEPGGSYSIKGIQSFIVPLFLALTNGVSSAISYSNKLKYMETEEEKEIKAKDKDKFDKLFGGYKLQASY
ncbi:MAG: hypothetical protein IJ463_04240 [Bacilli bacterium]|nr:hypothetical protein [Bacilli bacterium]